MVAGVSGAAGAGGGGANPAAALTGVKWKKLAAKALAEARTAPGGLGSSFACDQAVSPYQGIVGPRRALDRQHAVSRTCQGPHNACTLRPLCVFPACTDSRGAEAGTWCHTDSRETS